MDLIYYKITFIMKHAIVIGAGFGGLGTAGLLAKLGYKVTVLEKNEQVGGRASVWREGGFTFDMGPSWYLMPDLFERFFELFGERVEDYYELVRLSPSYRIDFLGGGGYVEITGDLERDAQYFEQIEPGAGETLKRYVARAKETYDISVNRFICKNYDSLLDFLTWEVMKAAPRLSLFTNMKKFVGRYFNDYRLQQILMYPLVFLGASPANAPAIYHLMSHLDFNQGVFYPMGGIYKVVEALEKIAKKHGATIRVDAPVAEIVVRDGMARGVVLESGEQIDADVVISNAGFHHTETKLVPRELRMYSDAYFERRTMAPSGFMLYLGLSKKLKNARHHGLLFDADWDKGFAEIFDNPMWPDHPSLYYCAPSVTDPSVAPQGKEALFVLVPVASGLECGEETLKVFRTKILGLLSHHFGESLESMIELERMFTVKDFAERYNAHRGTALGYAHTLFQTATFRPANVHTKIKGLYFVGGETNPGIGMPMCLVSAELIVKRLAGISHAHPLTRDELEQLRVGRDDEK